MNDAYASEPPADRHASFSGQVNMTRPVSESQVMFLDCPAYFGEEGSVRCDLPAAVEYRYTQGSTGGQLESAKIRCPRGHWFNGPIEFLA
jgi:hypothetical protein